MGLTDSVRNALLDAYFGHSTLTVPTTFYLSPGLTVPNANGTGTSEPAGFTRIAHANDGTFFPNATAAGGVSSKGSIPDLDFGAIGGGPYLAVYVWDAATGGNLVAYADHDTAGVALSVTPSAGQHVKILGGQLVVKLTG